ncbi:GNAT family N-acetyltransferase [Methylophaga thiooxydans]|uniref:GNAT family N-acetyltransferase n=1 Tax=Methylophaga thiooxydans TaxID=392484 RepID=UPI000694840D
MRESDLAALCDVYFQTRSEAFHLLNPEDVIFDDFQKDTDGERVWVATLDDRVVGFISIWEQDNFIHHLYVLPKFSDQKLVLVSSPSVLLRLDDQRH